MLVCALGVLCGELRAQDRAQDTLALPMERTHAGWLLTAWVCVPTPESSGGGICSPRRLLLDTGANETALDAAYLSLPRTKEKLTVHLGAGSEERAVLAPIYLLLERPTGRPAKWAARVAPLDVDFRRIREACQCAVAGLAGVNFLEQFDSVTFDFKAKTLTLRKARTP